jgi:hypothetical protein
MSILRICSSVAFILVFRTIHFSSFSDYRLSAITILVSKSRFRNQKCPSFVISHVNMTRLLRQHVLSATAYPPGLVSNTRLSIHDQCLYITLYSVAPIYPSINPSSACIILLSPVSGAYASTGTRLRKHAFSRISDYARVSIKQPPSRTFHMAFVFCRPSAVSEHRRKVRPLSSSGRWRDCSRRPPTPPGVRFRTTAVHVALWNSRC